MAKGAYFNGSKSLSLPELMCGPEAILCPFCGTLISCSLLFLLRERALSLILHVVEVCTALKPYCDISPSINYMDISGWPKVIMVSSKQGSPSHFPKTFPGDPSSISSAIYFWFPSLHEGIYLFIYFHGDTDLKCNFRNVFLF